jgi:vacuolar-type H+-ATPase subunit C/Vma6
MTGGGERAYAYARACGIIRKSFVGRRTASLRSVSRLSELNRLIFGSAARELPERELLPDMERRLARRSAAAIRSLVNSYKKPPEPLVLLLRSCEYEDLKNALALRASGSAEKPDHSPLGRFGQVRFDAFPDPAAMLGGTEFEFLLSPEGGLRNEWEGLSLETVLDRRYYRRLWQSLFRLRRKDRRAAELITAEEISLRNCVWVLRLRSYYGMEGKAVAGHLIDIEENPQLIQDARSALELPLDDREAWEGWKRLRFLNPGYGRSWRASPRRFQNAAAEHLYRLALRHFHRSPGTPDSVFCFIKLKQFEEDLLISAAETLGMGMAGRDVAAILEGSP